MVKPEERGVGGEPLFGRPRQSLDDQPGVVIVPRGLPGEGLSEPAVIDCWRFDQEDAFVQYTATDASLRLQLV